MMLAVVGAALVLVALPGIFERVGRRLASREWTWLCAGALAAGLALLEIGMVLRSAPPVLRAVGVGGLARACERLLGPLLTGGPTVGWAAGAAAIALAGAVGLSRRSLRDVRRRVAAELWLGERRVVAGHPVVVLPVARPLALSFEHRRHRQVIVVSNGLLDALSPTQVAAVVRHEAAHLRYRHQRLLTLATVADRVLGWLPPVARSAAALHLAVERWADEEAARPSPAARQAVRDSLLTLAGLCPVAGVAGFADVSTLAARITALESPPPPPPVSQHVLLYLPGSAVGLVAGPALLAWGDQVRMVLAMAGRCPI